MSLTFATRPKRVSILAAYALMMALAVGAAVSRAGPASAAGPRPTFQLPFPCNTRWRLNTYAAYSHNPALDIVREPQNQTAGTPVLASAAGTVKEAGFQSGSGNYVLINHGGSWYTVYIHLRDRPLVRAGQSVAMGTTIGYIGHSGTLSNGVDHLHYEQLIDANGNGYLEWGVAGGEDVAAVFNGVTYTGGGGEWRNVQSHNTCGSNPGSGGRYWVQTFASASVYASSASTRATGTLNAGNNYVFCKVWGRRIANSSGSAFNHWWLKTDPDRGPANQYVSAYWLSRWGNDEAKDNSGVVIPNC